MEILTFEFVVTLPCHVVSIPAGQFIRINQIGWILLINAFLQLFVQYIEN